MTTSASASPTIMIRFLALYDRCCTKTCWAALFGNGVAAVGTTGSGLSGAGVESITEAEGGAVEGTVARFGSFRASRGVACNGRCAGTGDEPESIPAGTDGCWLEVPVMLTCSSATMNSSAFWYLASRALSIDFRITCERELGM